VTDRPEVHALLALMLFQASRLRARTAEGGGLVLIPEQDRTLWDRPLIHAALRHLDASARGERLTLYHLEAGIAACHAGAPTYEETDWSTIVDLYDALLERTGSPVVALNRAVAIGMRDGPDAALPLLDQLASDGDLERYFLLPATIGDMHMRRGDVTRAAEFYELALALPASSPQRAFLRRRLRVCRTA
jgi:RNA polymerase sigma-70 factor (ECF subfamily)